MRTKLLLILAAVFFAATFMAKPAVAHSEQENPVTENGNKVYLPLIISAGNTDPNQTDLEKALKEYLYNNSGTSFTNMYVSLELSTEVWAFGYVEYSTEDWHIPGILHFIARKDSDWKIEPAFTPEYDNIAAVIPQDVFSKERLELFHSPKLLDGRSAESEEPRWSFPFKKGNTWRLVSGPHGWASSSSAWSGLDYAPVYNENGFPVDKAVRPMADGVVLLVSDDPKDRCWVLIRHNDYWVSHYYHLSDVKVTKDQHVTRNTVLADIAMGGTDEICGRADGPHVHVDTTSLPNPRATGWMPVAGRHIGGYQVFSTSHYNGYLQIPGYPLSKVTADTTQDPKSKNRVTNLGFEGYESGLGLYRDFIFEGEKKVYYAGSYDIKPTFMPRSLVLSPGIAARIDYVDPTLVDTVIIRSYARVHLPNEAYASPTPLYLYGQIEKITLFDLEYECKKLAGWLGVYLLSDEGCTVISVADGNATLKIDSLKQVKTQGRVVEVQSAGGSNVNARTQNAVYKACIDFDITDVGQFYYPGTSVKLNSAMESATMLSATQCDPAMRPVRVAGTYNTQDQPPKDTSSIQTWDYGCPGASIRIYNADGRKCAPLYYGRNDSLPFSPARVEVNIGNVEIKFCPDKSSACHEVGGTTSLVGSSIYGKISRAEVKRSGQIDNINDYVKWCKTRTGNAVEFDELETGVEYYTDKGYEIKNLPESYVGMKFLRMPNADKHNSDPEYVTCELRDHVKVVLAVDPRGTLPDWVRNDFKSEGQEIGVTDNDMRHFDLYGCKAESGKLVLGGPDSDSGNSDANYIIIFKRMDTRDGSDRCNAKFNVKPDVPVVYPIANSSALTEIPLIVWEQTDKNTGDKLFAQVQVSQNGNTVYDSGFLPEGVEQHVPVINGYGYFTARVVVKDLKGEWNVSNTVGFTIVQPDCNHVNFGEVAITTSDSCRGTVHKLGNSGKVDLVSKGLHDGDAISVWVPRDSWALLLEKADGSAGENCVGWYNGEPGHKWATTVDHWWRRGTELNYTINGKIEAMVIGNSSENMYCQGLHPYETEPFASYTLGENPYCTNPAILAGHPEQANHWTYEGNGQTCGWNYNGWISNNGRFISFNVTNARVKMYHDGINSCGGTFDLHAVSMWWLLPHETECSNATPTPGATPTPSPTNTPFPTPIATSTPTPTEIPPSLQTLQAETDYSVVVPNSPDPQGFSATFGNYGAKRVIKLTSEHHGWLRIRIASDHVDNIYMSVGMSGLWTVLGEFSSYAPDARIHEYEQRFGVKPFSQVGSWSYEAMVGASNQDTVLQTVSSKLVIWPGAVVYVVLKSSAPANETPYIAWQRHRFCNEYPDNQEAFISDEGACYGNRLTLPGTGTFNLVEKGWYGKVISLRVPLDKWALALENANGTGGEVCTGNFAGEAGSRWNTKEDFWWENGQQTSRTIDGKIALIIIGDLANQYCNGLRPTNVTATPTATPTRTPASANTVVPTNTPVPTGTQNPTPASTPTVVPTATSTVVATNTPVVIPSPTTEAPFGIYNLDANPNCYNPAYLAGLPDQASYWTYVGNSGCGWAYNGWLGNNGRFVRLHITTPRVKVDHDGSQSQCGGDLDTSAVTLWWLGEQETVCPGSVNQNSVQIFLPLVVR